MTYGKLIDGVIGRLKLDLSDTSLRQIVGNYVNDTYKEIARQFDWEVLKRSQDFIANPLYQAGTVTATNGSRTVTGLGTVWTSDMQGAYIKIGSTIWQEISSVDTAAQTAILQSPFIGVSGSGLSYSIWSRYNNLFSDVFRILKFESFYSSSNGTELESATQTDLHDFNGIPMDTPAEPTHYSVFGSCPYNVTYSTGLVTLNKDSNVMIGVGTSWLGNVFPGDIVSVGDFELRVSRVESDIQIILCGKSPVSRDSASSGNYTISRDNPLQVQIYPVSPSQRLYNVQYLKRVYSMTNDGDRTELGEDFDLAIIDGAEACRMRDSDDPKWAQKMQEYNMRIVALKSSQMKSRGKAGQFKPFIPSRSQY